MATPLETEALLGLSLAEAQRRLDAAGLPAVVVKSEPPRPRQAFPPEPEWRVVRARLTGAGLELVVVPPITGPATPPSA